ncbi:MAG: hypothetical protein OCD76_12005 [Reichenbachiella sp.]
MREYTFEGEYNLKLTSKKLKSGKCQVKFHASIEKKRKMYGYVLAESGETVKSVVEKIHTRLDQMKYRGNVHHINLHSIGRHYNNDTGIVMFDA